MQRLLKRSLLAAASLAVLFSIVVGVWGVFQWKAAVEKRRMKATMVAAREIGQAAEAFIEGGMSDYMAEMAVKLIADLQIPNVKITY